MRRRGFLEHAMPPERRAERGSNGTWTGDQDVSLERPGDSIVFVPGSSCLALAQRTRTSDERGRARARLEFGFDSDDGRYVWLWYGRSSTAWTGTGVTSMILPRRAKSTEAGVL
ncbi:hypothetical protein CPLU01_04335 [Colletotrichum plurivorum]|uniref:Uncharacterized protein n=1 Tax=Colletotrichum plurivorum TaxID=2175906 RepID=A0A8H6KPQ7_9PEZI|nr:hypothetical protein CPLU01_04335 [Colletotrichum plurivorum]